MTMLLRDVSMRGTQTQDRQVAEPRNPKLLLRRYALIGVAALL